MDKLTQEDEHNATIFRLLALIENYRKARAKGTRADEHKALACLFEFAEEVADVRRTDVDGS